MRPDVRIMGRGELGLFRVQYRFFREDSRPGLDRVRIEAVQERLLTAGDSLRAMWRDAR